MLWKIDGKKEQLVQIKETDFRAEQILEKNLENWIEKCPEILDEQLLIIGRQVLVPEVKDKIDLLAIDQNGYLVIIELKRDSIKDPVDIQALRYASYVSRWSYDEIEATANDYYSNEEEFNLNAKLEEFAEKVDLETIPDLNADQRIIIVGRTIREKLGSVALWLYEHNIDIKVIELHPFVQEDALLIQPEVVVPLPISKPAGIGKGVIKERPWLKDGKTWHLEKRCGKSSRELLLKLNDIILDNFEDVTPSWNQKYYVSYKLNNANWLYINPHQKFIVVNIFAKTGKFDEKRLSTKLGVEIFKKEGTLAEKLTASSSIYVKNRSETLDKIVIRIKEDFDIEKPEFLELLQEAFKSFMKV